MGIEDRPWRLVAWGRADGTLAGVPEDVDASATFAEGRVSGSTGCNRYTGPYRLEGDSLSLGPLAGTLETCAEPRMSVEHGFLAAAGRVARVVDRGHAMTLLDGDGRIALSFIAASATPLAGTPWTATAMGAGGTVAGLVSGTSITARFGEDGRVTGSAGCNRYVAAYATTGSAIAFGPPATTRRLCAGPAGLMAQEEAFLVALARSTRVRVDGDRLELRDDAGALQLAFRVER